LGFPPETFGWTKDAWFCAAAIDDDSFKHNAGIDHPYFQGMTSCLADMMLTRPLAHIVRNGSLPRQVAVGENDIPGDKGHRYRCIIVN
jgi:hypothetical protein